MPSKKSYSQFNTSKSEQKEKIRTDYVTPETKKVIQELCDKAEDAKLVNEFAYNIRKFPQYREFIRRANNQIIVDNGVISDGYEAGTMEKARDLIRQINEQGKVQGITFSKDESFKERIKTITDQIKAEHGMSSVSDDNIIDLPKIVFEGDVDRINAFMGWSLEGIRSMSLDEIKNYLTFYSAYWEYLDNHKAILEKDFASVDAEYKKQYDIVFSEFEDEYRAKGKSMGKSWYQKIKWVAYIQARTRNKLTQKGIGVELDRLSIEFTQIKSATKHMEFITKFIWKHIELERIGLDGNNVPASPKIKEVVKSNTPRQLEEPETYSEALDSIEKNWNDEEFFLADDEDLF